ncbi:hypothetical protein BHM03_00026378 [Ensete ventricosum]|nr:hypothetical protein BHM03_00026378 [Ensete ventricosum]
MDRDVHYFDHDKFFFFLEVSPGLLLDATTFVSRSMINHEDTFGNCYATTIDGSFPPAWVGIGNAYAAQGEGDQAMAAFRSGARLCHLPPLYIGMEYMQTHNYKLAEQKKREKKKRSGLSRGREKEEEENLDFFPRCAICRPVSFVARSYALCIPFGTGYRTISSKARYADTDKLGNPCTMISLWCIWENTFRMFQKAISCYEKALAVSTQNFSAFAGLAYTYHLQDNFDAAITYYHKVSLRVNCDYN